MAIALDPKVKRELETLYRDFVQPRMDREKVYEYAKARKCDLYWNGAQNLHPIYNSLTGAVVDWETDEARRFRKTHIPSTAGDYTMNRYRAKGRKFVAVLGNKAPTLKCIPIDDGDLKSIRMSRYMQILSDRFDRQWKRDGHHLILAYYLYKYGTSYIYTPYVTDKEKYGFYTIPEIEAVQEIRVDPETGDEIEEIVIRTVQEHEFVKGGIEYEIIPPTMASCPHGVKKFEKAPWFFYQFEEYAANLIASFPDYEDTILRNLGYSSELGVAGSEGRRLRDQTGSPTYSEFMDNADRVTFTYLWFHPGQLMMLRDKGMAKEILQENPRGVRLSLIANEIVDTIPEFYADVLTPVKPEVSDTLHCDGIGYDFLHAQDLINDNYNVMAETYERSATMLFLDPNILNVRALQNTRARPMQIYEMVPGKGPYAKDGIREVKGTQIDSNLPAFVQDVEDKSSDGIGVTPQISGAGEGAQTAKEYELRMNAALRQLTTTWKNMREAEAEAQLKAIHHDARNRKEPYELAGELIEPQEILDAKVTIEAEEFIPKTFGERRDVIREMLDRGPDFWSVAGVDRPSNVPLMNMYLGLPGWDWPRYNEYTKIMMTLEELLLGEPVQGFDGQMIPSIPPDPTEDDPSFMFRVLREWTSTAQAIGLKKSNPNGYQNVKLYMQALDKIVQQQAAAMQQQQMMAGGAPPEADGTLPLDDSTIPPAGFTPGVAPPALEKGLPFDPSAVDPNVVPGAEDVLSVPLAQSLMP